MLRVANWEGIFFIAPKATKNKFWNKRPMIDCGFHPCLYREGENKIVGPFYFTGKHDRRLFTYCQKTVPQITPMMRSVLFEKLVFSKRQLVYTEAAHASTTQTLHHPRLDLILVSPPEKHLPFYQQSHRSIPWVMKVIS
jgi:hypothetical protein